MLGLKLNHVSKKEILECNTLVIASDTLHINDTLTLNSIIFKPYFIQNDNIRTNAFVTMILSVYSVLCYFKFWDTDLS